MERLQSGEVGVWGVRGASSPWRTSLGGSLELAVGGGLGSCRSRELGACSRWRVRASRRRCGLEAQPCLLCHANLRVHVGRTGESSPATWQGPSSTAATLAAVGTGRRDSPHRSTTRVQVTCNGLVGLFRSTKSHVIKAYGSSLTPLSMRVVFSLFICVKVVAPCPLK